VIPEIAPRAKVPYILALVRHPRCPLLARTGDSDGLTAITTKLARRQLLGPSRPDLSPHNNPPKLRPRALAQLVERDPDPPLRRIPDLLHPHHPTGGANGLIRPRRLQVEQHPRR
jgi:hypothetical protein